MLISLFQQHATPQHLHITTRCCFIGPIPDGWLKQKHHRKAWYKHSLNFSSYSSRAATFSTTNNVSHQRHTTGIDGVSELTAHGPSFPRPDDADEPLDEDNILGVRSGDDTVGGSSVATRKGGKLRPVPSQRDASGQGDLAAQESRKSVGASSFVTAPDTRINAGAGTSYEQPTPVGLAIHEPTAEPATVRFSATSSIPSPSSLNGDDLRYDGGLDSRSSLLHEVDSSQDSALEQAHDRFERHNSGSSPGQSNGNKQSAASERSIADSAAPLEGLQTGIPEEIIESSSRDLTAMRKVDPVSTGLVRFNLPDNLSDEEQWVKTKVTNAFKKRQLRRPKSTPGVLIKSEKMLVRVDYTIADLPSDYDENSGLKTETRAIEKWQEFVVVCRKCPDETAQFVIQLYKSRVIPAIEQTHVDKRCAYEIPLIRKTTKLNLYSSLDKTIVMWAPYKRGTRIYILRARSSASSVEWYTFLRSTLGWKRSSSLKINVPDLNVTLQLANPFEELHITRDALNTAKGDADAMMRLVDKENTVASTIISRCMDMLGDCSECSDIVGTWSTHERMGLAWKRYDRLEWVHGVNEQKMYGTFGMETSHELELRPKQHYPTTVVLESKEKLDEPAPVEGYLIRLTSQQGQHQRFRKGFSKRAYFSTHNQFLCFCKPSKAMPPAPPKLPKSRGNIIPSMNEIAETIPIIYAVNPYPIDNGQISWLTKESTGTVEGHDQVAFEEAERKVNMLLETEGYFNLCHVRSIRDVQRNESIAPEQNEQQSIPTDIGPAQQATDDRTFEFVLKNGLVVRLQAYDKVTKTEWITRLTRICDYWKLRVAKDLDLYKMVRNTNLKTLDIDEEMESFMGQYARKWEVTRSMASPQLFNMCGISCCRTITVSFQDSARLS